MIKLIVLLTTCAAILVGCSPPIISANPRSIVFQNGDIHDEAEMYRLANSYCRSHGRYDVLQQGRKRSTFECVE